MGGKSKSSADNTQNTQEVVTTLGDNRVTDTGNIGGNVQTGETAGDVNVTTTDFGAIESGQEVSLAALDFGGDAVEGGFDLAGEAIVSSQDITEQAIDLTQYLCRCAECYQYKFQIFPGADRANS